MKDKIILIGNGFDLAHGLKTSYKDMFVDYKNSLVEKIETTGGFRNKIKGFRREFNGGQYIYDTDDDKEISNRWICLKLNRTNMEFELAVNPKKVSSLYFEDLFLQQNQTKKWSDLEEFYFRLIKKINVPANLRTLNSEFDYLKKLLSNYIKKIEDEIDEKNILDSSNILSVILDDITNYEYIHFVSFNYTVKPLNVLVNELKKTKTSHRLITNPIHVHSQIKSTSNPIIFGYGDDNSEDYRRLQEHKNIDYLKNFKTFQYLRNENYKSVIGLLDNKNKIDIHVIGHSLGLTDKTLLKTIFNHPNVEKIEIAYHNKDLQFFENIYNASRIIDDNELMRKKIVDLVNIKHKMIKSV